jgi:hypothetical protein
MKVLSLVFILTVTALPAFGQGASTPPAPPASAAAPPAADPGPAGASAGAGPATLSFAGIAGPGIQFLFNAERKDKKGTVAVDWGTGTTQMRLSLSAPLNSSEETTAATLTGLANGAEFRYGLTSFTNPGPNPEERQKLIAMCQGLVDADNNKVPPPDPLRTLDDCDRDYVFSRKPDLLELFDFYHHLEKPIWLRGFEFGVSQAKYDFLTPVTLKPDSQNHANFSVSGRVGRYSVPTGFLIGSVTFTRNEEAAGPAQNICRSLPDVDDKTATKCGSGIIGEPQRTDRVLATFELRKFFSDFRAFTPSVSFGRAKTEDEKWKQVWSVDVPVYFIEGPGNTLGGIRFGWRSDKEELTAAIFVGAAIGLVK